MSREPRSERLDGARRRALLVQHAGALFVRDGYDRLSMAEIARAAGVSKPLIYHYFPSKRALFAAVLAEHEQRLGPRLTLDAAAPVLAQLTEALDAFLGYLERHRRPYLALMRSATGSVEVAELLAPTRRAARARLVALLGGSEHPDPALGLAVAGWLALVDGACIAWLTDGQLTRERVRDVLLGALAGALAAAGVDPGRLTGGGEAQPASSPRTASV